MTDYILLKEPDTAIQEINQKVGELDKIKLDNNVRGHPFNKFKDWRTGVEDLLVDLFSGETTSREFLAESAFHQGDLSEVDSIKQLNDALDKSKIYLEQLNNGVKMGVYRPFEQANH